MMKSTVLKCAPEVVYCATDLVSSVVGSTFMPAPGWTMVTITSPISRAKVVTTSKYNRALMPTRPSFFMSPMPAMPVTTVVKMMGAIIMRISLMKPSPKGFMFSASGGLKNPSATPSVMATRT